MPKKKSTKEDKERGERIRGLREARGLSVRALAKLAGVNQGTLWKIEAGETSPSVGTLKSILQALGTTLGAFFSSVQLEEETESYVFRPSSLVELSGTKGASFLGVPFTREGKTLQMLHEFYMPGAGTGRKALRHAGEEAGFCLSGTMQLTLAGKRYVLGPGDAFHYRSETEHRWKNVGGTRAEMVTACTPPTF